MANEQTVGQALRALAMVSAATLTELVESISQVELDYLDGVTAGTVTALKALVADVNKDLATLRHLTISGNFVSGATTLSETDLAKIDGITNGAQAAGKAVVADTNVNTGVSKVTALHIGASGAEVQVTATPAELNQAADLNVNGGLVRTKKISISATPTGAEQDTGWNLPASSVVLDVFLNVTVAEATGATKTLDVGLLSSEGGGDTDGFLRGVSVATTGIRAGAFVNTVGGNNTYIGADTTHTKGALLLGAFIPGEDVAGGGDGVAAAGPHVVGTAVSVVYDAGSNDWAEFRGDIYIVYLEVG